MGNIAPSTPRTSASVPLMTPPTDHSEISRSVLFGVMEVSQCMDLNVNISPLQINFDDDNVHNVNALCSSPSPPINSKQRRFGHLMYGKDIKKLNQCTYEIIKESQESEMKFSELLDVQSERLEHRMSQVTVAMSFLSLLTVCSDSYHNEHGDGDAINIQLDENEIGNTNMMQPKSDFVIKVSKN